MVVVDVNYWLGLSKPAYLTVYRWRLQPGGLSAVRFLTWHLALSIPREQSRSYVFFSDLASELCSIPSTAFLWLQVTKSSPDSERGDTDPDLSREEGQKSCTRVLNHHKEFPVGMWKYLPLVA